MPLSKAYKDPAHIKDYINYQKKYTETVRESDSAFLALIKPYCKPEAKILDIGCNTGNFLRFIHRHCPDVSLYGVDIVPAFIAEALSLSNGDQSTYSVADICSYQSDVKYDLIIANAAMMYLNDSELIQTMMAAAKNLAPQGTLMAFDYFHPFVQNMAVREFDGVDEELHLRSYEMMRQFCQASQMEAPEFQPFTVSSVIAHEHGTNKTYTRKFEDGENASFRGVMYQPWCFMTTRKK